MIFGRETIVPEWSNLVSDMGRVPVDEAIDETSAAPEDHPESIDPDRQRQRDANGRDRRRDRACQASAPSTAGRIPS